MIARLQFNADAAELIDAFAIGGQPLASRTFAAIIAARGLNQWEAIALRDRVLASGVA